MSGQTDLNDEWSTTYTASQFDGADRVSALVTGPIGDQKTVGPIEIQSRGWDLALLSFGSFDREQAPFGAAMHPITGYGLPAANVQALAVAEVYYLDPQNPTHGPPAFARIQISFNDQSVKWGGRLEPHLWHRTGLDLDINSPVFVDPGGGFMSQSAAKKYLVKIATKAGVQFSECHPGDPGSIHFRFFRPCS